MSVNRSLRVPLDSNLKLEGHLEKLGEPGQAPQYFDASASKWTADASATVPVVEHPDFPGKYRIQLTTDQAKAVGDGRFEVNVVNPENSAGFRLVDVVELFVIKGSDSLPMQSTRINVGGRDRDFYGVTTVTTTTTTVPMPAAAPVAPAPVAPKS